MGDGRLVRGALFTTEAALSLTEVDLVFGATLFCKGAVHIMYFFIPVPHLSNCSGLFELIPVAILAGYKTGERERGRGKKGGLVKKGFQPGSS